MCVCVCVSLSLPHTHTSLPLHRITPDSLHGTRAIGSLIQVHPRALYLYRCSRRTVILTSILILYISIHEGYKSVPYPAIRLQNGANPDPSFPKYKLAVLYYISPSLSSSSHLCLWIILLWDNALHLEPTS